MIGGPLVITIPAALSEKLVDDSVMTRKSTLMVQRTIPKCIP